MNNRMSKQELLELMSSLKIDKEEFWVLSSSQLVLRDIFPNAGDLDIAVTKKGLEQLKQNYNLKLKDNGFYIVNDKVECIHFSEKEDLEYPLQQVEGYYLQNIKEYYNYLIKSKREKDIARIPIVEKYIKDIESIPYIKIKK